MRVLPVNVAHLVYGVDGKDHFTGVEPSHFLRKVILKLAEQRQDISTHIVVHHQVLEWGERCGGCTGGGMEVGGVRMEEWRVEGVKG